jgi:hypothetical protein
VSDELKRVREVLEAAAADSPWDENPWILGPIEEWRGTSSVMLQVTKEHERAIALAGSTWLEALVALEAAERVVDAAAHHRPGVVLLMNDLEQALAAHRAAIRRHLDDEPPAKHASPSKG